MPQFRGEFRKRISVLPRPCLAHLAAGHQAAAALGVGALPFAGFPSTGRLSQASRSDSSHTRRLRRLRGPPSRRPAGNPADSIQLRMFSMTYRRSADVTGWRRPRVPGRWRWFLIQAAGVHDEPLSTLRSKIGDHPTMGTILSVSWGNF